MHSSLKTLITIASCYCAVACGGNKKGADSADALDNDGPAEEAGEALDQAGEDADAATDEASEDVEDAVDEAGEDVEDAADDAAD